LINRENCPVFNKTDQFSDFLNQISDLEFFTGFTDIHGFD
jgi:hypothetical protein